MTNEANCIDPLKVEMERLSTLLATTENSLREAMDERTRERDLRKQYERDIVSLKGDICRVEREKADLRRKMEDKDHKIEKVEGKRRQATERFYQARMEADSLRRANDALRRQVEATDKAVDNFFDGPSQEAPAPQNG